MIGKLPVGTRVDARCGGFLNGTPGTVTAVTDSGDHTVVWDDGLADDMTWDVDELAVIDTDGNEVTA